MVALSSFAKLIFTPSQLIKRLRPLPPKYPRILHASEGGLEEVQAMEGLWRSYPCLLTVQEKVSRLNICAEATAEK